MAAVRSKDTRPERQVRLELFAAGYRYRLNQRRLPGSPDMVLARYRTVIFVHGCFWHGHDCRRGRRPASNVEFWNAKLDRNIARDRAVRGKLEEAGWNVVTIWTCSTADGIAVLFARLNSLRQDRLSAVSARSLTI
jgi:DNA mismatch endonuclease (patch repair protein)